ncbi:ribulose-5-phosphate 3-epimerase [Trypanosoma rangeli]|uniref:Ribulose-phosphate 3-epimerase n=1 Tax=Trypanosoma rangeli TaxID=5698 RepID=A0A3R7KMA2_TRYRA|nr:ribulose-5-phosphate 3-epimerase [Trypanosoma rangeli]RNF04440.1 ribulose-5-phosphate 3-epimerase [Trypanosoma rangeli]|eukprot:RNF04440.1 ribulose-5-phosphate 3-epimerase [Trypanosoma rangeli]
MFHHHDRATWLSSHRPEPLRPIIAPSILAFDFARLLDGCLHVLSDEGGASEWIHVDVMDGHFVPNISVGMCVVESLRKHLQHVFLDVHCMITNPDRWVEEMAKAGASQMTFHFEAAENPKAVANQIRAAGMQCGVALKPSTPASAVKDLVEEKLVDTVLVMTVEPGFGGQTFMQDMMPKIAELRQAHPLLNIQVDGGVSEETIYAAAEAGANIIVAGTAIFKAADKKQTTETMRNAVRMCLTPK